MNRKLHVMAVSVSRGSCDGGELIRLCAQSGGGKARKKNKGKAAAESRVRCYDVLSH